MGGLPRFRARLAALLLALLPAAAFAQDDVLVRWLGVAGFSITAGDTTLLHDPYLSRPSLWKTATSWYEPDAAVLEPLFSPGSPAPELARASAIWIGHSHFDHLGDAAWIAKRTGARLYGSQTSISVAEAYGLDSAQTDRVDPGHSRQIGPFTVRVIRSFHAGVLFGRAPLEGTYETPPEAPLHALSFRLGDARLYLVRHEASGVQILITSSAAVDSASLYALRQENLTVDLLLAATQGRDETYARALVSTFHPRLVIPHHYESFFVPLSSPDAVAPSNPDDLAAFEQEIRDAAAAEHVALDVRRLGLFESLRLPAHATATAAGG
jgi:L-ascorbate metabolism protein UlaG (beta-lactamase superfamily)